MVYIKLETTLEGDEDTLIMAVKWLVENTLFKKEKLWAEIIVDDYNGDYANTIFGRSWRDVESIGGTIKFGVEARERMKLPREVAFSAMLTEIETPKKRFAYEGVKVVLEEPIKKTYLIKGLETDEFKVYKVE